MPAPNEILKRLLENNVDFVLVGGLAAVAHGVSTMTQDIDVCFSFQADNIERLLTGLEGIHPCARAGSGVVPIDQYEVARLAQLGNLYLRTDLGELDLLGQIIGLGEYERVKERSSLIEIFGFPCRILHLDDLIKVKEAMDRPKDRQVVLELRAIREKLQS